MTMDITITEVASRDGLQNEKHPVSTEQKIELIGRIARAGMKRFEVTSFVSPRAVPALADAEDVVKGVPDRESLIIEALVPNQRGAERAAAGRQTDAVAARKSGGRVNPFTRPPIFC